MISNETVTLEKVLSEFKKISNQYEEDKIKLNKTVELLEHENRLLKEQLEFFKKKLFGKSSEKTKGNPNQISLFDIEEVTQEEKSETAVEEETITYTRRKPTGKRQDIFEQFTPELVHHELLGEACVCPECQHALKEIGSCVKRKELVFIPAQLKRVDHIQHAYKCPHCSENGNNDKIIKATVPKAPLNHSLGSSTIIAHTIYQKYQLKVPNYRQEADWNKMGLPITRKELTNWHIKVSEYYFKPLYNLLREVLLKQSYIHADETSYRVLENDTPLTYYWTFLSGKQEKAGITLYHHDKSRSGEVVKEVLGDYSGYIHCDMWGAYRQATNAKLVGCWAHVRRKFFEANPKNSKTSLSAEGLNYCNKLFQLEQEWDTLPVEKRHQKRQEEMKPIMDEFFNWCREHSVLPGSKLGKAIEYSLKYESTFRMILEDGNLVLSNNLAERAVKTLVIGRKNWLFSQSFEGAQSSAIIMTLLETAKRNGLDSEKYINYLLTNLPNEDTLEKNEILEAYLPWNKNIQETCR